MKKNYWLLMLVGVLVLGIGYAAISNISLVINGGATATGSATDEDFKVRFVKSADNDSEFSDVRAAAANPASYETSKGSLATATASVTDNTNATFSVTGLSSVGEYVTFTYYIVNLSEDIPAYIYVDVINSTNDESNYFKITKTVANSELTTKGSVTPVTVKVEVVSLPKLDKTGNFTVKLVASQTKNANVEVDGVSSLYATASTTNEIDDLLVDENIDNLVLTLTDDIDYGEEIIDVTNKNITMDLNGNDFTGSMNVKGGSLEINDTTGTGTFTGKTGTSAIVLEDNSTLTVNGGTINSTQYYGTYVKSGSVVINGGTIDSLYAPVASNNTTGDMNLEINGGTLISEYGPAIYMPTPQSLVINDGLIDGGIAVRMGNVTINGGTITAVAAGATEPVATHYNYSGNAELGEAITVWGGTYSTNSAVGNDLNLTINGGTIKSENGVGTALYVLNLGKVAQNINININGGVFSTTTSGRNTFEIINANDLNATNTFKAHNNHVNVTITDGSGLTGVTSSGNYWNTTTPFVNGTTSY